MSKFRALNAEQKLNKLEQMYKQKYEDRSDIFLQAKNWREDKRRQHQHNHDHNDHHEHKENNEKKPSNDFAQNPSKQPKSGCHGGKGGQDLLSQSNLEE